RQHPSLAKLGNLVSDSARPAIELRRSRRKKASSAKHDSLDITKPALQHGFETRDASWTCQAWFRHFLEKDFFGRFHRGQLKLLLRPEVGKDPRFAHLQLAGKPPNGEPLQPLSGRYIHCDPKDFATRLRSLLRMVKNRRGHRTIGLYT